MLYYFLKKDEEILLFLVAGTTARCTSIRLILGCLCWQLDVMFGRKPDNIPSDYPALVIYFRDALDRFSQENVRIYLISMC